MYVDPAERVAQSTPSVQAGSIRTWVVSEVDKKGKKKKGTLGIGNGAIFFASESDKVGLLGYDYTTLFCSSSKQTPVQQWQSADVQSSHLEKSKHVHIDVGGSSPANLHFNAGSKDTAEAIMEKLESSGQAVGSSSSRSSPPGSANGHAGEEAKPKRVGVSVHFASAPPSIISPREPSEEDEEDYYQHVEPDDDGNDYVAALYDFAADGDDELTVSEGERLILIEKDSDEWWKVRNSQGMEGVVPAQYVELVQTVSFQRNLILLFLHIGFIVFCQTSDHKRGSISSR